tara:strand:+ start:153 stop:923 length:771 start_codon:yes stop_codon:yes gene_type:complete
MIIGVSLGLIGSGGSILTVPLLVYFFGLDAVLATAYSLFIVGVSSAIGATRFIIRKQTDLYVAALFAVPSLVAVYLVRRYLVPSLPAELFTLGDISVSRDTFILVFFALIMLLAATRMIRSGKTEVPAGSESRKPNILLVVVEGLIVGSVTGFVGAGGGFLIIPALVLLVGLPMKKAVATSLLIIAVKSLFGFIGDVQSHAIDWTFLITLAALASAGIYLGMYLGKKVDGSRLKKGFGYFVLLMALFMIIRESGIV